MVQGVVARPNFGRATGADLAAHLEEPHISHYVGADVSKNTTHIVILDQDDTERDAFTVPNTPRGFAKLTNRLDEDAHIEAEASTHIYPLAEHLLQAGYGIKLGHPRKLAALIDPDYKDDDRDA